jgi:hypothetical protein
VRELAVDGNPGIGPWGFNRGPYADSWYVVVDGRVFHLTRWSASFQIVEMQFKEHQPYSWIPDCHRFWQRTTDWIGVNSEHQYIRDAA